nr:MAG TPA: hypothetical protein [Caudoviricetes sp.]DAT02513.1 MAG TPA: hypothetical protein [Caudoviricetes sp.]
MTKGAGGAGQIPISRMQKFLWFFAIWKGCVSSCTPCTANNF